MKVKTFDAPNDEWGKFVVDGRKGTLDHAHDAVSGPMLANPRPAVQGKAKPKAIGQQFAMFTQEAADVFNKNVKGLVTC